MNVLFVGMLLHEKIQYDIIGTYICDDKKTNDSIYLVFTEKGTYQIYKQFQRITFGTYTRQQKPIYKLETEDTQNQYVIYDGRDTVFCFIMEEGQIYQRINKLPVYLNLNGH